MRKILVFFVVLLLSSTLAFSQNRVVTGQVTDDKGEPVGYATIKVKDGKGTSADANGNFKIEVKNGAVLQISALGISPKEVKIDASQSVYNVGVTRTNSELGGVVVSALGIKRSVKSTPYATQQVSSERLTQARETDLTTALTGKIAGLQTLGQSGAKLGDVGQIRLRGAGALRETFAIYVVDGTIMANASDINMDDVENVNVLKGPNATALYGQRAEGGVVIITTKKAKTAKLAVDFNHTTTAEQIAYTQRYQNIYGSGRTRDPQWRTFAFNPAIHPAEWQALNGVRFSGYEDDESWGPKMDGQPFIPWYAWYGGHQYSYKAQPYNPQPNNIKDFFNTGLTINNNVSLGQKFKNASYRVSYTYVDRKGLMPNTMQNKHTVSTQSSVKILKKLELGVNVTYSREKIFGDFDDTYGNQTTGAFNAWFHRDLDVKKLRELQGLRVGPNNTLASWNHGNLPDGSAPGPNFWKGNYWINPFDNQVYNTVESWRDRIVGDATLTYTFNNSLKLAAAYRVNYRTTRAERRLYGIIYKSLVFPDGKENSFSNSESRFYEHNLELIGSYNKRFGDFTFDANFGGNILYWNSRDSSRSTSLGLTTEDAFSLANSVGPVQRGGTFLSRKKVLSAFAKATVGYKDFIYLDMSARQDFSSVLPTNANGYFYPSLGTSFVFTQFLNNSIPALSFGKLRASWAQIGTDALGPFAINQTYTSTIAPNMYNNFPLTSFPNVVVDPNLLPTLNSSFEVGADFRFYRDRIGLSVTYFNEKKTNDIVTTSVSGASGVSAKTFNVGRVQRQGLEVEINATPVKTRNFSWDITLNWSRVNSMVQKVSDQQQFVTIADRAGATGDQFGHVTLMAIEGQQWGQLRGRAIRRINGVPVIGADGLFLFDQNVALGSILPNYNGGMFNQFRYKNFTLSASVDYQNGGKFFSMSHIGSLNTGLLDVTAATNDNGMNVRDPLADGGGVHVHGVTEDGKPVSRYVEAYDYFKQFSAYEGQTIAEAAVFDASYIKVREISLGYNFNFKNPKAFVKRLFVSGVARNPFRPWTTNPGFDPTELSRSWGENGQLPGTRSYGINLRVSF